MLNVVTVLQAVEKTMPGRVDEGLLEALSAIAQSPYLLTLLTTSLNK